MVRFEVRTKNGMQDGLQEADIARMLFSGKIDADTICRRHGSPNWFRLAELFPHLKTSQARAAFHANLQNPVGLPVKSGVLLVMIVGMVCSLFFVAAQKMRQISSSRMPQTHLRP